MRRGKSWSSSRFTTDNNNNKKQQELDILNINNNKTIIRQTNRILFPSRQNLFKGQDKLSESQKRKIFKVRIVKNNLWQNKIYLSLSNRYRLKHWRDKQNHTSKTKSQIKQRQNIIQLIGKYYFFFMSLANIFFFWFFFKFIFQL